MANDPVIVKTEKQEFEDQIWSGVFGLVLVAAAAAIAYLNLGTLFFAGAAAAAVFTLTCFVRFFRVGYLALVFWSAAMAVLLGAVGLIIAAIVHFVRNN